MASFQAINDLRWPKNSKGHGKAMSFARRAVLHQPCEFQAILTLRHFDSTSTLQCGRLETRCRVGPLQCSHSAATVRPVATVRIATVPHQQNVAISTWYCQSHHGGSHVALVTPYQHLSITSISNHWKTHAIQNPTRVKLRLTPPSSHT